jgi:O-antigen biosynthesis protein
MGGEEQGTVVAQGAQERYAREIDLDSDSTHARVVRLVGPGRRVLELGPGPGDMSRVLQEQRCSVVGIEVDPELAAVASRFCERMIVGDLDLLDLQAELGSERFDVILAADVLEHLKDPLSLLQRLRDFLAPDGYFVISVPNVAHGSVRLALLQGRFRYQRGGLLDRTHLRFFTWKSLEQLLDEAGLGVAELHRQELDVGASEVQFDPAAVPEEVLRSLESDPEARTYQFVLRALPFDRPGLRELLRQMRESAQEIAELHAENARLSELEPRFHELQATLTALSAREGELRSSLIDAHDQLLRRDEEIHRLRDELEAAEVRYAAQRAELEQAQAELGQAEAELAAQRELVLRLRVRLDRIQNSPLARAYAGLRRLPGLRNLAAARTAAYNATLTRARDARDQPQ